MDRSNLSIRFQELNYILNMQDSEHRDREIDKVLSKCMDDMMLELKPVAAEVLAMIKKLDSDLEILEDNIKSFKRAHKIHKALQAKLRCMLKSVMLKKMQDHIDLPIGTVSVRQSGGRQKLILPEDLRRLPAEFLIQKTEADTDKIRNHLDNGESIPFVELAPRETSLMFKWR